MIWTHLQEDTQFVGHFLFHFVLFDFRMRGGRRFESLNSQTRRDTAFLSSALQWRRLKPSVQPRGSWCASPRGITLTYPSHPTSNHSSPQDGTMTALIRLHLISIAKGQHYLSSPTFIFSVGTRGLRELTSSSVPCWYLSKVQRQLLWGSKYTPTDAS